MIPISSTSTAQLSLEQTRQIQSAQHPKSFKTPPFLGLLQPTSPKTVRTPPFLNICGLRDEEQSNIQSRSRECISTGILDGFFNILDLDASGYITSAKLRHVLAAIHVHMDDQAMAQLVELYDRRGSGQLKLDDLKFVITDLGYTLHNGDSNEACLSCDIRTSQDISTQISTTKPTLTQKGEVDHMEFEDGFITLREISDEKTRLALSLFDSEGSGRVQMSNLKRAASLLNRANDSVSFPPPSQNKIESSTIKAHSPNTRRSNITSASNTTNLTQSESQTSGVPKIISGLHWSTDRLQLGLAPAIHKVNHIAIIVSDVGRSAAFYTNVMGFQQIRRPNFDRHGAWFTMGNIELHLIKGVPAVHSGEDLIVGHISFETPHIANVPKILKSMGVPFRQNVSVPKGKDAGQGTNASADSEMIVEQYFVRDPDGYWVEICNCDVLTDYCLDRIDDVPECGAGAKNTLQTYLPQSSQSRHMAPNALTGLENMPCGEKATMIEILHRWSCRAQEAVQVRKAQAAALRGIRDDSLPLCIRTLGGILGYERCEVTDEILVENLRTRMTVYADVCQNETDRSLIEIVRTSGNDGVAANKIMNLRMELGRIQKLQAPGFYENGHFVLPPITVMRL